MRGSVLDLIFLMVLFFVFAIAILFAGRVLTDFRPLFGNASINTSYVDSGLDAVNVWNNSFIFVVVGGGIAVVLGAFLIRSHPAFAIVSMIAVFIIVLMGAVFSNFYNEFASTDVFSTQANQYTIVTAIEQNMPAFAIIFGSIVLVVLFGKARGQSSA